MESVESEWQQHCQLTLNTHILCCIITNTSTSTSISFSLHSPSHHNNATRYGAPRSRVTLTTLSSLSSPVTLLRRLPQALPHPLPNPSFTLQLQASHRPRRFQESRRRPQGKLRRRRRRHPHPR